MKQYFQLAISFIQFHFGLLFWDFEKMDEFLHNKFIQWHGPGFRFWYNHSKTNPYYILTIIEDNKIVFYFLNKGTFISINDSDRKHYNPSLFHTDAVDAKQKFQFPLMKDCYHFKHYKNYTDINEVVNKINYNSMACAIDHVFDFILSKHFVKTFIPIYFGKVYSFYRRN